jgi:ubiquinone/menaquinone biosynthesis C-methylase UbiE
MAAAERIKPGGRVLAIDFSENMLALTRTIIDSNEIVNIDIYTMPAEELDIDSKSFDRVICNFGLTFFSDPKKALDEMNRVLKDNGRVTLSTWAKQDKCLVLGLMDTILKDCLPALKKSKTPSVFDLGTIKSLQNAMTEAGFREVMVEEELHSARYLKAEDYWEKLYRTGPELRKILSDLSTKQIDLIRNKILEGVEKYRKGDKIILPSVALIGTGLK